MYNWDQYFSSNDRVEFSAPKSVYYDTVIPFRDKAGIWMTWMGEQNDGLYDVHFDSNTVFTQADYDAVAKYSNSWLIIDSTSSPDSESIDPITHLPTPQLLYTGTSQNDVLIGNYGRNIMLGYQGSDTIYGGAGDDFIRGGKGDDIIYGGAGNDILYGDKGRDTFVYTEGDDVICEFNKAQDTLNVSNLQNGIDFKVYEFSNSLSDTVTLVINEL